MSRSPSPYDVDTDIEDFSFTALTPRRRFQRLLFKPSRVRVTIDGLPVTPFSSNATSATAVASPTPVPVRVSVSVSVPVPVPVPETRERLHHIDNFFSTYSGFQHNPHVHPSQEFKTLSQKKGWDWKEKPGLIPQEAWNARRQFQSALVKQFNTTYGKDENDLKAWQALCGVLKCDPIPETLSECRSIVMGVHVNLIDLLAAKSTGKPVHKFPTEVALSKYTIAEGKIFPREHLEAGSLLKNLLRNIFSPSEDRGTTRGDRTKDRTRGGRGFARRSVREVAPDLEWDAYHQMYIDPYETD